MPMAYSPQTKLFYVPANEWGMDIWNEPVTYKKGGAYLGAGFTIHPINDDYIGVMRAVIFELASCLRQVPIVAAEIRPPIPATLLFRPVPVIMRQDRACGQCQ